MSKIVTLEKKDGLEYFYLNGFDSYDNFESIVLYLEEIMQAHLVSSDLGIYTAKYHFFISGEQFVLEYHEDIGICFYSLDGGDILKNILLDLESRLSAIN